MESRTIYLPVSISSLLQCLCGVYFGSEIVNEFLTHNRQTVRNVIELKCDCLGQFCFPFILSGKHPISSQPRQQPLYHIHLNNQYMLLFYCFTLGKAAVTHACYKLLRKGCSHPRLLQTTKGKAAVTHACYKLLRKGCSHPRLLQTTKERLQSPTPVTNY